MGHLYKPICMGNCYDLATPTHYQRPAILVLEAAQLRVNIAITC